MFRGFLGTYAARLDEKGRLILPAKLRDAVAEGLVMTKGQERCLSVFASDAFHDRAGELNDRERAAVSSDDKKSTRMQLRQFTGNAAEDTPDRQGRITIPPALRAYAGLDRAVMVVGAYSRIEIWDSQSWQDYDQGNDDEFAEVDA